MTMILNRRRFALAGLSLPFLGATARLPAPQEAPEALLDRYLAFVAHEHQAVLVARDELLRPGRPARFQPMYWLPDDPAAVALVSGQSPLNRAALVLRAAGLAAGGAA